uniref:Choline transporter-like protein n=1 Tax=Panagrolaimus davidi TaxID=227884 RepID=A0A914QD51_9BILA
MLSTLFFPFIPFALHIIVFAIWGSIAIWLASSGEENCRYSVTSNPNDLANGPKCDCELLGTAQGVNCRYVNYTRDTTHVQYMQVYNLFACFWMSCFVGAFSDITLAGAFASYYWAFQKPKDVPSFPVLSSAGRALRYHMGSLAFGSLILAIVKIIRFILEFLYQKLHASKNAVLKVIFTYVLKILL